MTSQGCQRRLRQKLSEPDLVVLGLSHINKALFLQNLGNGSRSPSRCFIARSKRRLAWRCLHSDTVPTRCKERRDVLSTLSSLFELWGKGQEPVGPPEKLELFRWPVMEGEQGLASH